MSIVLRLGVAAVFVWGAIPKLIDPAAFVQDINNYRMLPEDWAGPIAVGLPVFELVIAAALIAGIETRGAAILATGLLGAFTIGMLQAMARGIDLDCGCFGEATEAKVGWGTVARNVGLITASALIIFSPETSWPALARQFRRRPT